MIGEKRKPEYTRVKYDNQHRTRVIKKKKPHVIFSAYLDIWQVLELLPSNKHTSTCIVHSANSWFILDQNTELRETYCFPHLLALVLNLIVNLLMRAACYHVIHESAG